MNKTETDMSWDEVKVCITPGDIVTSKKGFLSQSPMTGKFYVWKKAEHLGRGGWRVLSEKQEVEISPTGGTPGSQ